jgi:hypothetical protein
MRLSEFWDRMDAGFGAIYARSLAKDYRVPALEATVEEALARGDDPKVVWRAVCVALEVPAALR